MQSQSKILPEARDKQVSYHRTAIDVLFQIATQKQTIGAKRLAKAALSFLETQGDPMVAVVRQGRES